MQLFHKGTGRRRFTQAEWQAEFDRLNAIHAEDQRAIASLRHHLGQADHKAAEQDRLLRSADKLIKNLAGQVVHAQNATKRAEAEQARLRQAVINARPKLVFPENHARVAPYFATDLPMSYDTDGGLQVAVAPYPVRRRSADPFAGLDGHDDGETTLTLPVPDLAGAR